MQKSVLIIGCPSGIGLGSAFELRRQSFQILTGCHKPDDITRMDSMGFTDMLLGLDSPESVDHAADEVIALTDNRLCGTFNDAGYGVYSPLSTINREQMEQQFSTNFFGIHQLTMRLLSAMSPHGEGRTVMTSSIMGLILTPGCGTYTASKHTLEARSDALRMELRHSRTEVSLIKSDPVHTRFTENVSQILGGAPIENPDIVARFTLEPEAVAAKVRHVFESDKPELHYPITLMTWAVVLPRHLLPGRIMNKISQG